jgi:type IV pilus assembly protein PilA
MSADPILRAPAVRPAARGSDHRSTRLVTRPTTGPTAVNTPSRRRLSMQDTLRRMQQKRANGDRGFTLVELLVVVVIIGILVAIAIPLYLNYRKGAANKTAESDVRAAITAVEQYYTSNANTANQALVFGTGATAQTANVSPGNTLGYRNRGDGTYVLCGVNSDGGQYYIYDSKLGGSVKTSTQTTMLNCLGTG